MALLGDLDISGAGFLKTVDACEKGFGKFTANLGKFAAAAAGGFAVFSALDGVFSTFKETLDLGGTLNDMHLSTGEAVGDLVILRQAFDNASLGAAGVEPFIHRLQDSIAGLNEEGKSTAGALNQLGTSADELRNLPAIGQIEKLTEGFERLDQTTKVQAARDLFGKSGGKALALFGDSGALDLARQQAAPLASVMEKNVEAFDQLGDAINGLKLNGMEFFAGVLSGIAPEVTDIADAFGAIDFRGLGEAVGSISLVFLEWGHVLASLAPLINDISEGLSGFVGSSDNSSGLADNKRGFARLNNETPALGMKGSDKPIASGLQKIGGGGGFGGGDAILGENQKQTRELEGVNLRLDRLINAAAKSSPREAPPI